MLLFALRIGWDTRDIFEIDLPVRHGSWTLHRLVLPLGPFLDAIVLFEDAIDRPLAGYG